jgi:hypothetical protein
MHKIKKAEEQFVDRLAGIFSNQFQVQREVWSECRTRRIDLILTKDHYHFGIECKPFDKKKGEQIGKYVKQAINYQFLKWKVAENKFQRVPILICPAISYNYFVMSDEKKIFNHNQWHKDRHNQTHDHHSFNGFLGEFGIGEIRKCQPDGYQFTISNHVLFYYKKYGSEVYFGVNEQNYIRYVQKFKDLESIFETL